MEHLDFVGDIELYANRSSDGRSPINVHHGDDDEAGNKHLDRNLGQISLEPLVHEPGVRFAVHIKVVDIDWSLRE